MTETGPTTDQDDLEAIAMLRQGFESLQGVIDGIDLRRLTYKPLEQFVKETRQNASVRRIAILDGFKEQIEKGAGTGEGAVPGEGGSVRREEQPDERGGEPARPDAEAGAKPAGDVDDPDQHA
jgi:hypothetical protein